VLYIGLEDCFASYEEREKLKLQNQESETQIAAVKAVDKRQYGNIPENC